MNEGANIMRFLLALGLALVSLCQVSAHSSDDDKAPARYGVEPNLRLYPQGSAKQTLASVIEAYENKRIPYLAAYLASPTWVDQRVTEVHQGDFEKLVKEIATKYADDPKMLEDMKRFLKEGDWEGGETTAVVKLKDIKDRQMFFRKIGKLWYLENKQKPEDK
jgi:hypothetical protein